MIPDPADGGLHVHLPGLRRARDYRLYDASGRRYLDLWQADGHAILGHRPNGVSQVMKAAISRGLVADLPSVRSGGLHRALRALLPDHPHVRVYGQLGTLLDALSVWRGGPVGVADLPDPAAGEGPRGDPSIGLWRPFAGEGPAAAAADALVPVLPFVLGGSPWAVCFRRDPGVVVPQPAPVSPVVLEGAAAATRILARHETGDLVRILGNRPPPAWTVRGVYLMPRFDPQAYTRVFRDLLAHGVVLSPRFGCPSILPAQASPGEAAGLVGLLRGIPLE